MGLGLTLKSHWPVLSSEARVFSHKGVRGGARGYGSLVILVTASVRILPFPLWIGDLNLISDLGLGLVNIDVKTLLFTYLVCSIAVVFPSGNVC